MTRPTSLARLLRWYPQTWRERYGDELLALLEDSYGDDQLTLSSRWSIARAGLAERARGGGWFANSACPEDRVRAGALIVIWAWAALVIAGATFAKVSEHFTTSMPSTSSTAAVGAWRAVEVSGGLATIGVLVGAVVAVPAYLRARRDRRLVGLRVHVVRVLLASLAVIVATTGFVEWAHTLPAGACESGAGLYGPAFVAWAAIVVGFLLSWTSLAVALARRVTFTRTELAAESVLAVVVGLSMLVIGTSIALWWHALAAAAPWFLHGTPSGTHPSAFDVRLLGVVTLSATSIAAAAYGLGRIARSWSAVVGP